MAFNINPMTGSDGPSSVYTLYAVTEKARIGWRDIGCGKFRVRVEPQNGATFSFPLKWKTPGSSEPGNRRNRYSVMVRSEHLKAAVLDAFRVVTGIDAQQATILPAYEKS